MGGSACEQPLDRSIVHRATTHELKPKQMVMHPALMRDGLGHGNRQPTTLVGREDVHSSPVVLLTLDNAQDRSHRETTQPGGTCIDQRLSCAVFLLT